MLFRCFSSDLDEIFSKNQISRESYLSKYACKTDSAVGFYDGFPYYTPRDNERRPRFAHDTDKIIHSRSYTRYIDKTQVFYLVENDMITHRVLHVQFVSKIARTIGRFLKLNEDLIEAIALGHDVGHTPFGHDGESMISKFCMDNKVGVFQHNVQSFRLFHELEKDGHGINLSVQVLDGIICHSGEDISDTYVYKEKTRDDLLQEYNKALSSAKCARSLTPMTLEGCVVKISDCIAYIGRDIDDAITLGLIDRNDIPTAIREVLGDDNRTIINRIVSNIINNSYEKGKLQLSNDIFRALSDLQKWNNDHIYFNQLKTKQDKLIKHMFETVLDSCLYDLTNQAGNIFTWYIDRTTDEYKSKTPHARVVADYVSRMTDDYLIKTYKELVLPKKFGYSFKESPSIFI